MTSSSSQQWTPLECFPLASQTPSGLLQLLPTEVEDFQRSNIQLRSAMSDATEALAPIGVDGRVDTVLMQTQQWNDRTDMNLSMQVTTHRLVFWKTPTSSTATSATQQQRIARFLHLSNVLQVRLEPKKLFSSNTKLLLNTYM